MAYITKKELAKIINNAPKSVDKTKLLGELVKRGNILEGYNEKKTGLLTNVARDIVSPFVKAGELLKSGGQAYGSVVKAGFQQLTGNKEKAQETLNKASQKITNERPDTIGVFGQGVKTIQNKKQVVGTALEIGSNFVGAGGAKTALSGLKTPLRTVAKELAIGGAKTGAKAGTLYGAGQALNQDKSVLGGAISGAAGGAIGGAILSPALGLGGRALTQTVPNIKNKLLSSSEKRLTNIAQDLTKMSPTAIKKEVAWNKNTPNFLVQERVIPLIDSANGKIKADDAISALKAKSYSENAAFKNILQDSGKKVSLDEWGNRLKQEFTSELKNRGEDLDNAVSKVDKEVSAFKKNYADKIDDVNGQSYIDVTDFNDIKSGLWQKSSVSRRVPGSELDSDVFYQMGHTAKELIEEVLDDAEVARLNSRLGDFAQAIKVLESANGKVLPGGFIGKGLTKLAGTIAGAAGGGLPGSILGNITGGLLADITSNPKIRTGILAKIYNGLQKEGKMDIIDEAQKILEKRGLERASRKLLEAPKYIPLGGKSNTSRLLTQEEAQLLLDSMKIKEPQKLLKAPLGDKTNPIITSLPKGKGEILKYTPQYKTALEALRSPEMKAKLKAVEAHMPKKVTKTSNNLYHSTSAENLDSIIRGGLKTGQKPKFEGVSSPNKISFSANEEAAKYYGGNVMIRTKTSYKPTDLELDLLAGGEGTYLTGKNIPPEMLEIKVGGKWIPLTNYKKPLLSNNLNPLNFKTAEDYVKAQGTPVYHGTPEKFDNFSLEQVGKSTDSGMFGKGIYFTDDLKEATTYSKRGNKVGEVKEVILDLKKPYIIKTKADIPEIDVPMDTIEQMKVADKEYSRLFTEKLQKEGYDGVIDMMSPGSKQYVVFNPSQIKTKSQLISEWNKAQKLK